jgi:hypothetical protein
MDGIGKRIGSFVIGRFRYPSFVGIATQLANPAPTNWTPLGKPCSSIAAAKGLSERSFDNAQITCQPYGNHHAKRKAPRDGSSE